MNLRIAAIIPVYQGRRFLREAVQSVAAQSLAPAELVVVDDGSTDGSLDVLTGLALPFALRTVRQANQGQSAARNRGVRETDCDHIAFLDQDDRWHATHLEKLAARFAEQPSIGWAYSNVDEIDEQGHQVRRAILDGLAIAHPVNDLIAMLRCNMHVLPSASLLRRDAFLHVGGFDERLSGYEDDDLFMRLFRSGFSAAYVEEPTIDWRVWSSSWAHSPRMARSERIYAMKLISAASAAEVKQHIAPRFLGCARYRYEQAMARGDWQTCRAASIEAARYLPLVDGGIREWARVQLMRRPRLHAALRRMTG